MQQLEALDSRLQRLRAGVLNMIQLHQLEAEPVSRAADRQIVEGEVGHLRQAVDDFELELARRVVDWQNLKEPFWQAVRFGGLGILIGWSLAWLIQRG